MFLCSGCGAFSKQRRVSAPCLCDSKSMYSGGYLCAGSGSWDSWCWFAYQHQVGKQTNTKSSLQVGSGVKVPGTWECTNRAVAGRRVGSVQQLFLKMYSKIRKKESRMEVS